MAVHTEVRAQEFISVQFMCCEQASTLLWRRSIFAGCESMFFADTCQSVRRRRFRPLSEYAAIQETEGDSLPYRGPLPGLLILQYVYCVKGKGSPYSITERMVPELIPVLGSQPAGDVRHKPGGRLPLLSTRPAVTPATEAQWV